MSYSASYPSLGHLPAKDLQQFRDAIKMIHLIHELEKQVANRAPDKCAQIEKLAIQPVQDRLEKVTLAWILAVK